MSLSPYAPPLPYGGWVLSLTMLLGSFLWIKSDDAASKAGSSREREEGQGTDDDWRNNSSAYQTDQEVLLYVS